MERDVWGNGYKIVMAHFRNHLPPFRMPEEEKRRRMKKLFPFRIDVRTASRSGGETPLFTREEVRQACEKIKTGKAPGPDGITPKIVKLTFHKAP